MHHLTRQALRASGVLLCALLFVVGATTNHADAVSTGQPTTLSFAEVSTPTNTSIVTQAASLTTLGYVETSAPKDTSTVSNAITLISSRISLGSTLEAQGKATIDQQPLIDVPVALHMGDAVVATTHTTTAGEYVFAVPVGLKYFPAAMSGDAPVYTVVTVPSGIPSDLSSGVTNVAVNPLPFYALSALVIGVVLIILPLYVFRRHRKAPQPAAATPALPAEKRTALEDNARSTVAPAVLSEREQPAEGESPSSGLLHETADADTPEPAVWIAIESTPQAHVSLSMDNIALPAAQSEQEQHLQGELPSSELIHETTDEDTPEPSIWIGIESTPQVHVGVNMEDLAQHVALSEPAVWIGIESTPQAHVAVRMDNIALPAAQSEPAAWIRIK